MDKEDASVAFERIIQAGRQKKKHEKLAQEIFGQRRSSTPNSSSRTNLSASFSSRVGVSKRPASLSRASSSQSRVIQQATTQRKGTPNNNGSRQNTRPQQGRQTAGRPQQENQKHNINVQSSNGAGLNIKGAANGPYILIASNFADGTSAADLEEVISSVTDDLVYCTLLQTLPTVTAEMGFADRAGAERVINTFDKKKADGRVLYVSYKGENQKSTQTRQPRQPQQQQQVVQQPAEEVYDDENAMEVDENAKAREAENKLREERRGGGDRARQDVAPSGPRGPRANFSSQDEYGYNNNNNNQSAQYQGPSSYQDGRYGFSNGGGGGYGGRGGYYPDRRGYGRGGSQWRQ